MFHEVGCERSALPANCVLAKQDFTGRISLTELATDAPVLADQITQPGENPGLVYKLPPGQRAIALSVDLVQAVADFVEPGNYVDVLVAWNKDGHYQVRTLGQNILVLAMGHTTTQPASAPAPAAAGGVAPQATTADKPAAARRDKIPCVLAVTPGQAQAILLADVSGTVRLGLRGIGDSGVATVMPTKSWDVIGEFPQSKSNATAPPPAPAPPVAPPGMYAPPPQAATGARGSRSAEDTIEVVRGDEREVITPDR